MQFVCTSDYVFAHEKLLQYYVLRRTFLLYTPVLIDLPRLFIDSDNREGRIPAGSRLRKESDSAFLTGSLYLRGFLFLSGMFMSDQC